MDEALTAVGLRPEDVLGRFPHQLSGGQRQRINVARALLLKPRLLVADEPVSMVDASLRATILETLRNLQRDHGVSIIYITHDLTTAYHVANNIIVLYRGEVMESGDVDTVIKNPQHAYTRLLVDSIPWPNLDQRWGETSIEDPRCRGCQNLRLSCRFCSILPIDQSAGERVQAALTIQELTHARNRRVHRPNPVAALEAREAGRRRSRGRRPAVRLRCRASERVCDLAPLHAA